MAASMGGVSVIGHLHLEQMPVSCALVTPLSVTQAGVLSILLTALASGIIVLCIGQTWSRQKISLESQVVGSAPRQSGVDQVQGDRHRRKP